MYPSPLVRAVRRVIVKGPTCVGFGYVRGRVVRKWSPTALFVSKPPREGLDLAFVQVTGGSIVRRRSWPTLSGQGDCRSVSHSPGCLDMASLEGRPGR